MTDVNEAAVETARDHNAEVLDFRQRYAKAQSEIEHIAKEGKNAAQNYEYVKESDVLREIRKVLLANLLTYSVSTISQDIHLNASTSRSGSAMHLTEVQVRVTIMDTLSTHSINVTSQGQGMDSQDKGVYKATTGAVKYALMKAFLLDTGDDPERDSEPTGPSPSAATPQAGTSAPSAPSGGPVGSGRDGRPVYQSLTDKQKGLLFGRAKGLNVSNEMRDQIVSDVTGGRTIDTMPGDGAMVDEILARYQANAGSPTGAALPWEQV